MTLEHKESDKVSVHLRSRVSTIPPSSSVLEKAFLPDERDVITGIKELIRQRGFCSKN
jgi:hypothetical protein